MAAKLGSLMLLKSGDGGSPEVFTTVGAFRSKNFQQNANPIDVTTDNDANPSGQTNQVFIPGMINRSFDFEGVGSEAAGASSELQKMNVQLDTGATKNYQVVVPNVGTWTIPMMVGNLNFSGPYNDAVSFSGDLQSAGAAGFVAET